MKASENCIDRTVPPHLPEGFRDYGDFIPEIHMGKGIWEYNTEKIGIYISDKQGDETQTSIKGKDLYEELKVLPLLDANIMLWLWGNPDEAIRFLKAIYEKYGLEEDTCVFFWGTRYKDCDHGVVVFCMSLLQGDVVYQRAQLSRGFPKWFPALIMLG